MLRFPTIRLSAQRVALAVVLISALVLLIGKRLDLRFAGGEGLGTHAQARRIATLPAHTTLPAFVSRGETITTNAETFAMYTLTDTCTVFLAENTGLTLHDGRKTQPTFTLLTGRVVASGTCTFLTRETTIRSTGTVTLVHFSWLDELIVFVIDGETVVNQSGIVSTLTQETSAQRFFTLPSVHRHEPADFSLTEQPAVKYFYTWVHTHIPLL